MPPSATNILVLDDESDIRNEINEFFTMRNISVQQAATPTEAFKILSMNEIDIAILDIRLPEMSGLDVLKKIRHSFPKVHAIMMSGHGDMDDVIAALRLGAVDYLNKPFLLQEMLAAVEKTRKYIQKSMPLNIEHDEYILNDAFGKDPSAPPLIVVSPLMKDVADKMRLVARYNDTTVLITGESGTGKELVARGIHYLSPRKDKPFQAVNCSTIPDELFESEFFGYKKGAFTGANCDKPGWFEAADGGTLFLDEIGDLKPNLQAKLLRVIEDSLVSRLGSTTTTKVNVRVIAATNQDLHKLMNENRFRPDLYHRINTFDILIPPLRDRVDSISLIFNHYLEYFSDKMGREIPQVEKGLIDALMRYDYPGNVRELKHMVERALILCEGNMLTFGHFDRLETKMQRSPHLEISEQRPRSLENLEKESIIAALQNSGNNKSSAARMLKLSRQALDRRIEKLGISLK